MTENIKQLLYTFFSGQSGEQDDARLKRWLDESPENMARFLQERKLYDAMILSDFNEKREEQRKRPRSGTPGKRRFLREFSRIAAAVLIAVSATSVLFLANREQPQVSVQTISVPAGQYLNMVLPDGTKATLNARTTISYRIPFDKDMRNVEVDGQAFFDVAKDPAKPFVVTTDKGSVTALGTQFDVMSYSNDDDFETMLVEGCVQVCLRESEQTVVLQPSDKAVLRNGILETVTAEHLERYEWKNGILSFKGVSFGDIMETFEQIYGIRIEVENEHLAENILTAKFRMSDGPEYAFKILQYENDFKFKQIVTDDTGNVKTYRISVK